MNLQTVGTFVALVFLAVPVGAQQKISPQAGPNNAPVETADNAEYRLQPGDTVDIRFFFNSELNEQGVQIRPDGRISLQLVGDVTLSGRTPAEVAAELEKAYANVLKTPRITIQIRGFAAQKAFISGEVPRPGTISLASPMTVLAAIGEAGGITARGNRTSVVLIRKMPDGSPGMRTLQLYVNGHPTVAALTPLQPFDLVLVAESKITQLDRWVDQYIRQLIPANLNAGFTYLWQHGLTSSPVVAPF
jgi:polysaccharide export outer membrane protein